MSGSLSVQTLLTSPRQASQLFASATAKFPKQRHVFLVRFSRAAADGGLSALTFAVKSCDRPHVQPHLEELNQYNKKRQIHVGWKAPPLHLTLYDTAEGAALRMWNQYSQYYFGGFAPDNQASFAYDVTGGEYIDALQKGFGFTAANGGAAATDSNAEYYFTNVQIEHYYNTVFDRYTLYNPRISAFEPDALDYAEPALATISMQLVYEGVVIETAVAGAASVAEFTAAGAGDSFDGQTNQPANVGLISSSPPQPALYPPQIAGDAQAQGLFGFGAAAAPGVPIGLYNTVSGTVGGLSSGNGNMAQAVIGGAVAAQLANGTGPAFRATPAGLALSNQGYAQLNAHGAGTAQYGSFSGFGADANAVAGGLSDPGYIANWSDPAAANTGWLQQSTVTDWPSDSAG